MATPETVDETTVSIDIPEMISVKLADHEKEYWIEKDQLLEASAFFKGMFSWEFKESETKQVVLHDNGENIEHVFDIFIRFITRESYSMEQYIIESTEATRRFGYMQIAVFALYMHELWLDVFVLVNKYAVAEAREQVVRDLTDLIAIFQSGSTLRQHKPYRAVHPIRVHPSFFRQVHYNRVMGRFENNYPGHLQELFACAMRGYYIGKIDIQDTAFIDMAHENPHLALHVLPDWAHYIATNRKPEKILQVTNRSLYEVMERIVLENVAQAEDSSKEAKEREWPEWFKRP